MLIIRGNGISNEVNQGISCRWTGQSLNLLSHWLTNARRSQQAHYDAANRCAGRNYWFGIPVVILYAIVGTSVFATINEQDLGLWVHILVGLVSVSTAVLASLQTFLHFGESASKHRACGAEYGSIKREIQQILATTGDSTPSEEVIK
ncbi:SLATT domain-containing protein [Chloroflexota bacterium]